MPRSGHATPSPWPCAGSSWATISNVQAGMLKECAIPEASRVSDVHTARAHNTCTRRTMTAQSMHWVGWDGTHAHPPLENPSRDGRVDARTRA